VWGVLVKVSFHDVRHHVHGAGRGLIGRQAERELGVHGGELGSQGERRAQAHFALRFDLRDDAVAAGFAAGGGNGEYHADGQGLFDDGSAFEEIPKVAIVQGSGGNGFGRINHASAAHGQHEVGLEIAAECHALVNFLVDGVGLYAVEGDVRQTGFGEKRLKSWE